MGRSFYTLDVFTKAAFSGNPLGVVLDCDGLDGEKMQAIAAEFNLSETVFVTNWDKTSNIADIRIFTPKSELPFAGHPTVGSAVLLASLGGIADGEKQQLVLNEKVGAVRCQVSRDGDDISARFTLPKTPVRLKLDVENSQIAGALNLTSDDIGMVDHDAAICDAGNAMPVVPLNGLSAMNKIAVDEAELAKIFEPLGIEPEMYVYTKECVNADCHYHSRLFAPAIGITEDPATGGAAAALVAQIIACEKPGDGTHMFNIEQGLEMGRPSRISLSITVKDDAFQEASISGNAVLVSKGELLV